MNLIFCCNFFREIAYSHCRGSMVEEVSDLILQFILFFSLAEPDIKLVEYLTIVLGEILEIC